jgi:hypothetical protein
MKFTCSVTIHAPVQKVAELFGNEDNYKKWQPGFVSIQHISGDAGEPGAKSKIIVQPGKHTIELVETILVNNLPAEISALYEHKHMVNTMANRFTALGENDTRHETEITYTKFIGFMPKMMALLMPGLFKNQTQQWLEKFKLFAEKELEIK